MAKARPRFSGRAFPRSLGLAALVMFALAACQQAPPPPRFPPLSFRTGAPITLDVRSVDVRDEYTPPLRAPNVEHQFPETPATSVRQWAIDRLRATGGGNTAVLTLRRASAVEQALATETGVAATFTKQQATKVTGTIEAVLSIRGADGRQVATTDARVSRSTTLPEQMSLNERDTALYNFNKDLLTSFDQQMTQNIEQYLGGYLR
jgi:hypothetical protein